MSKRDFYDVLGVSKDADEGELKSAYRKLAMKNHPDRNPDDNAAAERFREATEAYEILKDPQKRAAYDRMGHAAFEGAAGGGFGGGGFGGGGFADIFDQMFSEFSRGAGAGQADRAGNDLRHDMNISLEEAFSGVQRDITVTVPVGCDSCEG
ncbi:MAG: DnaJ domain-containing protein, partial [Pseudomonadota bacterium]|nr:DnaJ domain-containing protein [Pseudomonadota bacterium]